MKKVYILLAALMITASSCKKDFIKLTPEDSYNGNTFFKTEDQFKQAVTAAYAPLRDVLVNDYFTSEMHSDNTIYQPYPSNRGTAYLQRENLSDFTNNSGNNYANAVWEHCYTGISRTNIVIERLAATSFTDAVKAPIDGEAKFLRALYYFKLVRLFGALPLFLKEVKAPEEAFINRTPVDAVYKQIIADATEAMTKLAAPAKFPQTGAATKGSATMLLAEVYATQKNWAEAERLLNTLPGMGYDLNGKYADVFMPTNKNSKESIFEVQYLQGNALGTTPNTLTAQFLPRTTNAKLLTGVGVTTDVNVNNSGNGGWNTPTQDLIDSYEAGDERLDASIGIVEGTYSASDLFTYSANKSVIGYVPAAGKVGVPYIKKYLHAPFMTSDGSNDNFPIYRYADALLLLAEVQNEQGKSPMEALSKVRRRAGLEPVTAAGQSALRDAIAHERRVELAFENHRWHDLVRTGKAIEVVNAFGTKLKQQVSYLSPDAYKVQQHMLILPLPQYEVELNPSGMIQNPGY